MNKLLAICGLLFIGNTATANLEQNNAQLSSLTNDIKCTVQVTPVKLVKASVNVPDNNIRLQKEGVQSDIPAADIILKNIIFLEAEEEIDLGFNTSDYLPENFDPNEVYVDLNRIAYLENDEDGLPDFDTATYLPKDFNPFAIPADISAISYIEEEPVLNIDTAPYLPEGFDPYEYYFDIHSIEYIEEEDELEFEFNTQDYLPRGFDPYSR